MNGRLSCLFVVLPSMITIIIILYILHHVDEEVRPWTLKILLLSDGIPPFNLQEDHCGDTMCWLVIAIFYPFVVPIFIIYVACGGLDDASSRYVNAIPFPQHFGN